MNVAAYKKAMSHTNPAITSTFLISHGSFYAKKAENVTIKLCSLNNVTCANKTTQQ